MIRKKITVYIKEIIHLKHEKVIFRIPVKCEYASSLQIIEFK